MNDKLPDGWVLAEISILCSLINGKAFKPTDWTDRGLPIIRIQNLNNPNAPYNHYDGEVLEKFEVNSGDLLFAWSGTPGTSFGAHIWRGGKAILNQHIFKILFNEDHIDKAFFKYSLNERLNEFIFNAQGGVGLRHITKKKFEKTLLPFPPLKEQKRIAAKLDGLLSSVDGCKARLDNVPGILERFRQSVLADATSGKLTEDWRKEHPNSKFTESLNKSKDMLRGINHIEAPSDFIVAQNVPENWQWTTLESICHPSKSITYGVIKLGPEFKNGIPCLRTSDVKPLKIETNHVKRISPSIANKYTRTFLKGKEVLVNVRGTLGGVAVVPNELNGYNISREVAVVPVLPAIPSHWVAYWIASPSVKSWLTGVTRGVTYTGINLEDLRKLPIALPPLDETRKIIHKIESLFATSDEMEQLFHKSVHRIDNLPASILSKAFRGELVPQDPNDEPAEKLLERIRAERQSLGLGTNKGNRTIAQKSGRGKKAKLKHPDDGKEPGPETMSVPSGKKLAAPKADVQNKTPTKTETKLDEIEILKALRKAVFRKDGIDRETLLNLAGERLGVKTISQGLREELEPFIDTAVNRKILCLKGEFFSAGAPTIKNYDDDFLIKVLRSVIENGYEYQVEHLIDESANYLGFDKASDAFKKRIDCVLEKSIQEKVLYRDGAYFGRV